ncbi:EcsC family protein [bacterium]|nr:EcsC family protein [bacterium]
MQDEAPAAIPRSQRVAAIRAWQQAEPTAGIRGLGAISNKLSSALTGTLKHAIPVSAIETALGTASDLALRTSARQAMCEQAGVRAIEDIRALPLEQSDALARRVKHRGMALAASSGAATGIGGAALIAADIPALLTVCLRTIHRTAMAYGYPLQGEAGRALAIGLFALATSNTAEEKQAAIAALSTTTPGAALPSLAQAAWREGVERLSERELTKQALAYSMHNLATQLGVNLAKRKAAAAVPVLGAVIGGSVNAWTVHDLARSTQFAFQAWRLGVWGDAGQALAIDADATELVLPSDTADN